MGAEKCGEDWTGKSSKEECSSVVREGTPELVWRGFSSVTGSSTAVLPNSFFILRCVNLFALRKAFSLFTGTLLLHGVSRLKLTEKSKISGHFLRFESTPGKNDDETIEGRDISSVNKEKVS